MIVLISLFTRIRKGKDYKKQATVSCTKRQVERQAKILVLTLEEEVEELLSSRYRSLTNFGECITFFKENTTTRTESTFIQLNMINEYLSTADVEDANVGAVAHGTRDMFHDSAGFEFQG